MSKFSKTTLIKKYTDLGFKKNAVEVVIEEHYEQMIHMELMLNEVNRSDDFFETFNHQIMNEILNKHLKICNVDDSYPVQFSHEGYTLCNNFFKFDDSSENVLKSHDLSSHFDMKV